MRKINYQVSIMDEAWLQHDDSMSMIWMTMAQQPEIQWLTSQGFASHQYYEYSEAEYSHEFVLEFLIPDDRVTELLLRWPGRFTLVDLPEVA